MTTEETNYYEVLQVDPAADQVDIDVAFRRLARLYHPDRNESTFATAFMQELNVAYSVLRDPMQRLTYDRQLQIAEATGKPKEEPATFSIHRILFAVSGIAGCALIFLVFINPDTRIRSLNRSLEVPVASMINAEKDAGVGSDVNAGAEENLPATSEDVEQVPPTGSASAIATDVIESLAAVQVVSTSVSSILSTTEQVSAVAVANNLTLTPTATPAAEASATTAPTVAAEDGSAATAVSEIEAPTVTLIAPSTPTNTKTPVPTTISPNATATALPTSTAVVVNPTGSTNIALAATATSTATSPPTSTPTYTIVPPTAIPTETATPVPTDTATSTATAEPTSTPTSTATLTPMPTATLTPMPTATNSATPIPTNTVPADTATPTSTSTATSTPTATSTALPTSTATPTNTALPPTSTQTSTATATLEPEPTQNAASEATAIATAPTEYVAVSSPILGFAKEDTGLYRDPGDSTPSASILADSIVFVIGTTIDRVWHRLDNGYWIESKYVEETRRPTTVPVMTATRPATPTPAATATLIPASTVAPTSTAVPTSTATLFTIVDLETYWVGQSNRDVNLYEVPADESTVSASVFRGTVLRIVATTINGEWYKLDDAYWIPADAVELQ